MREQSIIQEFQRLNNRINQMEGQLYAMTNVLREIVGKELMRGQALHKVLMDKGLFTDEDLKTALEVLVKESQEELKKQAEAAEAEKQAKVEILVPNTVRANSNQDTVETPAVIPVTEIPNV